MALDMIHADHRDAARLRQTLREHQADQQRADQSRAARDCDSLDVREPASRRAQRALDDGRDRDDVIARREFRHDAAVCAMDIVLVGDGARANFGDARRGGFEHRGGSVVARRFNSEYQHRVQSAGGGARGAAARRFVGRRRQLRAPRARADRGPRGWCGRAGGGRQECGQPRDADARGQVARTCGERLLIGGRGLGGFARLLETQPFERVGFAEPRGIRGEPDFRALEERLRLPVVPARDVRAAEVEVRVRVARIDRNRMRQLANRVVSVAALELDALLLGDSQRCGARGSWRGGDQRRQRRVADLRRRRDRADVDRRRDFGGNCRTACRSWRRWHWRTGASGVGGRRLPGRHGGPVAGIGICIGICVGGGRS